MTSSFCIISDDLQHDAGSAIAFIKNIISNVKLMVPNLTLIHYWTDSPTSQFRNKTIFDLLSKHQDTFGIDARWHYFEAGHGKGPSACDGIGGCSKRQADQAVRQHKR